MTLAVLVSIRVSRFFVFSSSSFFVSTVGDCTRRFSKDKIPQLGYFPAFFFALISKMKTKEFSLLFGTLKSPIKEF